MKFLRIKRPKIRPYGKRGAIIPLPLSFLNDMGADVGSPVSLYIGTIGGHPVLVIANSDTPELADQAEAAR
jgi:hypothetical protein